MVHFFTFGSSTTKLLIPFILLGSRDGEEEGRQTRGS